MKEIVGTIPNVQIYVVGPKHADEQRKLKYAWRGKSVCRSVLLANLCDALWDHEREKVNAWLCDQEAMVMKRKALN